MVIRHVAFAAMVAAPLLAGAIPAMPGIVTITTPDGRELRIEKRGGPFAHATFTDDGILLSELEDGTFVYAQVGANGLPEPSTVKACAAEFRTGEELSFIGSIDRQGLLKALETRDAYSASMRKAPAEVMKRERAKNPGLCSSSMPTHTGSPKCLVVLVEFKDEKFRTENPHEYFTNALTQTGFDSGKWKGSVLEYFTENSGGKFTPQFEVFGPVTLENTMKYYGANNKYTGGDSRPYDLVVDACKLLDENFDINFADYDNDGDGFVDNIFIYYAGFGEANSTSRPNTIWPHSADLATSSVGKNVIYDGVRINHYACCNEVKELVPGADYWKLEGNGVFIHEFSHVLGLPDLYETTYTGGYTPKYYSVLDIGSYNNDGHTPPNYSSYERYALGWMTPEELRHTGEVTLQPLVDSNNAFVVNTPKDNEYYLLENRRQEGWDTYIPNEGMLLWHIDFVRNVFENNGVNNDPSHQYVDLVEADNYRSYETEKGDVFPGSSNVTTLGFNTTPSLRSWAGEDLMREITNIHHDGRDIKFSLVNTDPQYTGVGATVGESGSLSFSHGFVTSSYPESVNVFDSLGRKAATIMPGSSVELPEGIYIVATPDGSQKIRI